MSSEKPDTIKTLIVISSKVREDGMFMQENTVVGNNYGNVGGHDNTVKNTQNDLSGFFDALVQLRELSFSLTEKEREDLEDCIEVIEEEVPKDEPKKGLLRKAWHSVEEICKSEVFQTALKTVTPYVIKALLDAE